MISKIFLFIFIIFSLFIFNDSYADETHKTTVRGCFDEGGTDGVRYFWLRPEGTGNFEVAWEEISKDEDDKLADFCRCNSYPEPGECVVNITYTTDPEDYSVSDVKGLIRKFNSIKKVK